MSKKVTAWWNLFFIYSNDMELKCAHISGFFIITLLCFIIDFDQSYQSKLVVFLKGLCTVTENHANAWL